MVVNAKILSLNWKEIEIVIQYNYGKVLANLWTATSGFESDLVHDSSVTV